MPQPALASHGASPPSMARTKLPSIQTLRAVAAILVVIFHLAEQCHLRWGWDLPEKLFGFGVKGVDIFFVLSGFIIFFIHQSDLGRPERWQGYFLKRLIRIYPIYWVILTGVVGINFIIPALSSPEERTLSAIVTSYLLIPQGHLPVLGVAWTLCHEMFFYLVFGLLILIPKRFGGYLLGAWIAATAVSSILGMAWPKSVFREFVFSPFNFEFAFGIASAWLLQRRWSLRPSIVIGVGIALFIGAVLLTQWDVVMINRFVDRTLWFGLAAAVLVYGSALFDLSSRPAWINEPGRVIGDASFSIYLVHYPVIVAYCEAIRGFGPQSYPVMVGLLVIGFFLAMGGGHLAHFVLERPLLNLLRGILPKGQKLQLVKPVT